MRLPAFTPARSISHRLALWYALAATLTLACLFGAGYLVLHKHLIHSLDALNMSEYLQIKGHLRDDYQSIDDATLARRLRRVSESGKALFYIDIVRVGGAPAYQSQNLNGATIPRSPKHTVFDSSMKEIGEVRVGQYTLAPFSITLATPLSQAREALDAYVAVCAALLLGMLVVSWGIGYGLSRLALRPVRTISDTANRIRSDNLSERIPIDHVKDEVSTLAHMLNDMFDRVEASFKEVRLFTADASHELKTPLAIVRLHIDKMLGDPCLTAAQQESLHIQLEELARLDHIIEELLFLSRAEARSIHFDLRAQDPAPFIASFAQDAEVLAEHRGLRFAAQQAEDGIAAFDEKRMRQVLLNLVSNAIKASPLGSEITMRSWFSAQAWHLSIEDQGSGLPPDMHERVFDRFMVFHAPGRENHGTGLGLAICRSIIQLHDGRIYAESGTQGRGMRFQIEMPRR